MFSFIFPIPTPMIHLSLLFIEIFKKIISLLVRVTEKCVNNNVDLNTINVLCISFVKDLNQKRVYLKMKRIILIYLLCSMHVFYAASVIGGNTKSVTAKKKTNEFARVAQFTKQQKLILQHERTTNLVIINDIQEILFDDPMPITQDLRQALTDRQVILSTKASWLQAKKEDNSFIPEKYICKEINDDYLLFVPEEEQKDDEPLKMQDALLGLSYTKLSDYDYTSFNQQEFDRIQAKCTTLMRKDKTGKALLSALETLALKDIDHTLLPFLNIYLGGHGKSGYINEINTESDEKTQPSDFLKVLSFFDKAFRTKSVALVSCFIGGKQIKDVYAMYDEDGKPIFDKFSNQMLENLSYSIINWGSLYKPTYQTQNFDFAQYFNWLNESVPNYEKVLKYIIFYQVDNYISVKLPHTSWFSPVQFKEKTQTLSQVAMSTREMPVTIKSTAEVIILEANYISQPVNINVNSIYSVPSFMPVNYHNQSYFFKALQLKNILSNTSFFEVLKSLIFINIRVEEEINFAFEKIQIGSVVYKNVHCFVSKEIHSNAFRTGFVYEDPAGRVFKYSWLRGYDEYVPDSLDDILVKKEEIEKFVWERDFKTIENTIQGKLSEAMHTKFIQELSEKVAVAGNPKPAIGKNLTKISLQLNENLIRPDDLISVIPVLEKEMSIKTELAQDQVKRVFNKLISKDVITTENVKRFVPLLNKGFNSTYNFVRAQSQLMMDQLIDQHLITTENWTMLMPIFKIGLKNYNVEIRRNVANLLKTLIDKQIIRSEKNIDSLVEQGIKDLDSEVSSTFLSIKSKLQVLKIHDFSMIAKQEYLYQPENLSLFLLKFEKKLGSSQPLDEQEYELFYELLHRHIITQNNISILLPYIEEGMNDSDMDVQRSSIRLLAELLNANLITEKNLSGHLLRQTLIVLNKRISYYVQNNSSEFSDRSVYIIELVQSFIDKNLVKRIDMFRLLPLIEQGINYPDESVRLVTIDLLKMLIERKLLVRSDIENFESLATNQDIKKFLSELLLEGPKNNVIQESHALQDQDNIDQKIIHEREENLAELTEQDLKRKQDNKEDELIGVR